MKDLIPWFLILFLVISYYQLWDDCKKCISEYNTLLYQVGLTQMLVQRKLHSGLDVDFFNVNIECGVNCINEHNQTQTPE